MCGGGSGNSAKVEEAAREEAKAERERVEAERELEEAKVLAKTLQDKRDEANKQAMSRDKRRSLLRAFENEEAVETELTRKTAEGA